MDYPVLNAGPFAGSTIVTIPRRTIYSSRAALLNAENYKAASARMSNGDTYVSKVWWDKR
jgi:hypothetical protein